MKAGKRQTPLLQGEKNALTGRYYTSVALLVGILEVYVDCATTDSALEQKNARSISTSTNCLQALSIISSAPTCSRHIIAEAMSRDWRIKK